MVSLTSSCCQSRLVPYPYPDFHTLLGFLASSLIMIYETGGKLHNVLERKHCGGSSGMCMCGQWFFFTTLVCVEPADDFRQTPDDQYQSGPCGINILGKGINIPI